MATAVALAMLMAVPIASLTGFGPLRSVGSHSFTSAQPPTRMSSALSLASPAPRSPTPLMAVDCAALSSSWGILYGSGPAPPAVSGSNESGCVPGPDEEGVTLVSNQTGSASRFELSISLPSSASSSPSSLSEFWISLSVSGLPCSLDGQSVLRIDLAPPGSTLGAPGGWALRAPVWGLDPAGSCDPRCENTTALYDLGGIPFCLDNTIVRGMGSSGGPVPVFAPGDALRITVTNGSGMGLTVYANDTTRPVLSTIWSYPLGALLDGGRVEPFRSVAAPNSGWLFGGSLGFGWTNCPWVNASGAPSCDSYDGAAQASLSYPTVTNSTFWNASANSYRLRYSLYDPWSSSGACQGNANLTACHDYQGNGGMGVYPSIHVSALNGSTWVEYGTNTTQRVGPLSAQPAGFASDGSAPPNDPAILGALSLSSNATAIVLSARATDPRGIGYVEFTGLWCFAGGGSTAPTPLDLNGSKSAGSANGSQDAFWTAQFPRGNANTGGTFYYSAVEHYTALDAGTSTVFAKASLPSGGLFCNPPLAPPVVPIRAVAISQGYQVEWSYPTQEDGYLRNYSIVATPTGGPSVVVPIPVTPTASSLHNGRITGLSTGSYTLFVHSTQVNGVLGPTAPGGLAGAPTLAQLAVNLTATARELVQPTDSDTFNATALGGAGPYSFTFSFGNGTTLSLLSRPSGVSTLHRFPTYLGEARVELTVNDSVGDVAVVTPLYVDVRATPDGVPLSLSTGDARVGLAWSPPVSTTAAVTRYVVFYSQSALSLAVFTAAWPSNSSTAQPVFVWNTTRTGFNFSASNGATVYAEVIAWDSFGPGLAPVGGPSLGVPTPFVLTGFGPSPGTAYGGAPPFTATLSASTTEGTANPLSSGIFTVSELAPVARLLPISVAATLSGIQNSTVSWGWANGSILFNATGTFLVQLHVGDAFSDPELIPSVEIYVGTGAPPTATISISALTPVPFAGTPVDFRGTASGTPGPYTFSWQFGDGNSSPNVGPSPSHRYAIAGVYTTVLTVTDNETGGSVAVSESVAVNAYPIVRISASEGRNGALAWTFQTIEIGGSGPPQVAWTYGDGTSGSGRESNHTYANPGEYTVRVTVADPAGIPTVSSNLTIYAGLPRSTQSFAQSAAAIGLILILSIGILVLAVLTVLFFRRSRPPAPSTATTMATYAKERSPPPRDPVE
ncbi:MAG: PKD domain-containing protein [Thermoplasmata archaeon]|nr:PKD domain-containing protein [Thermoplasmata archaeon]MCI4359197.1 PKD domain-containing protein [Thermoplasmata archaeon]